MDMEEWKHCVNRLLSAWTGYQLAIRMFSGGPKTSEKAEWFSEVIAEYVSSTKILEADDLSDWIDDILDNEFDLILEDCSTGLIASSLIQCKQWLIEGQKARLENFLSSLPSESAVQTAATESRVVDSSDSEEIGNTDEYNKHTAEGVHEVKEAKNVSRRCMEPDEDGWIKVTRR